LKFEWFDLRFTQTENKQVKEGSRLKLLLLRVHLNSLQDVLEQGQPTVKC